MIKRTDQEDLERIEGAANEAFWIIQEARVFQDQAAVERSLDTAQALLIEIHILAGGAEVTA